MSRLHLSPDFSAPLALAASTVFIAGTKGSGKTHNAGVMAEEMFKAGVPVVVLDPLGVWFGLRHDASGGPGGFPIVILGGEHGDVPLLPTGGEAVAEFIVRSGVVEAAAAAGVERVIIVETTGNELVVTRRKGLKLDSPQGRRMALADNAIGVRNLNLDADIIRRQAEAHEIDLASVGIDDADLEAMRANVSEEDSTKDPKLVSVDAAPPPVMTWVLIGVPTVRFGKISPHVESIAKVSGVVIETTSNSDEQKPEAVDGQ